MKSGQIINKHIYCQFKASVQNKAHIDLSIVGILLILL